MASSSLLSASEMADLDSEQESEFVSVCTFKSPGTNGQSSSQGNLLGTPADTTVPCWVSPGAKGFRGYGVEQLMASAIEGASYWTLSIPAGAMPGGTEPTDAYKVDFADKTDADIVTVVAGSTLQSVTYVLCEFRG